MSTFPSVYCTTAIRRAPGVFGPKFCIARRRVGGAGCQPASASLPPCFVDRTVFQIFDDTDGSLGGELDDAEALGVVQLDEKFLLGVGEDCGRMRAGHFQNGFTREHGDGHHFLKHRAALVAVHCDIASFHHFGFFAIQPVDAGVLAESGWLPPSLRARRRSLQRHLFFFFESRLAIGQLRFGTLQIDQFKRDLFPIAALHAVIAYTVGLDLVLKPR